MIRNTLSEMERRIAWQLTRGTSVEKTAMIVGLKRGSTEVYISKIKDKLGVTTHVGIALVMLGFSHRDMPEEEPVKQMGSKSDTYQLCVHHETSKSWLVSETGSEMNSFWLPRSQAETDEINVAKKGSLLPVYDFIIPDWLAREKGII